MAVRTTLIDQVPEKSTARITGVLKDEAGNVITAASLTTLTLTLYVLGFPSQIVNSRDAQNVLNANGVTVDASGNLVWTMTPADNAIIDVTNDVETHIALFQWTWNAGAKAGRSEIAIPIVNLDKVS